MLFKWTKDLSVGVAKIDHQHEKLIEHINGIFVALNSEKRTESIPSLFDGLIEYARRHFEDEERLMEQHGDPSLPVHREEHRRLLHDVNEFKADYLSGRAASMLPFQVLDFLVKWLVNHIRETDRMMGAHLNEFGVH